MTTNKTYSTLINDKPILKARGYKLTNASSAAAISMAVPTVANTTLTATALTVGSVATFTATAAHRFQDGQLVNISGASEPAFNGNFKITVTSTTVFTYVITQTALTTTAGGTPVAVYTPIFQQAILFAASTNAGVITFGPDANADLITLNASDVYTIQAPVHHRMDMSDWYFKSSTNNQNLSVTIV